jgi:4-carboxymuconolactone decarboxylase
MSDRYRKGVDIIQHLAGGRFEQFMAGNVAEVAPDFARMAVEFPFGDLYSRDRLDLRSRQIAAIASLATIGDAVPHLRNHILAALNLIEILMQTAVYAGFPAALRSLAACHDLLVPETEDPTCCAAGQG